MRSVLLASRFSLIRYVKLSRSSCSENAACGIVFNRRDKFLVVLAF